ncbi:MAG TPA: hypothetical protein VGF71_16755 [Caulobacteraceae bacterium]
MAKEIAPIDIPAIAHALNERAAGHSIGKIQDIRARLKSHSRRAGSVIFSGQTTFPTYAFHHGGRPELQFNIGTEFAEDGSPELRHGVAFSLEPSRTLPNIRELFPKVALFNAYMELYPDLFPDMALWNHRGSDPLVDRPPGPIPPRLLKPYVFIVFGKRQSAVTPDLELILDDFDRLLPLYEYVESGGQADPVATAITPFEFEPGFVERKASAVVSRIPREVNVILRHNLIQKALYGRLVTEHGECHVRPEQRSGVGTFIDLVVRRPGDTYWFYEIKTAYSARACVREALGQLLEYSNWPGSPQVERLIVVGEAPLDLDAAEYVRRLRERFGIPLDYEQVKLGR